MSSLDSEAKPDNAGHSVLALTTSHSLVVSSPETFLPDMRKELGIIADLVESYNDEPRQPGGCKLKTAPVRPVVAARPAE
ncbi:hypothetical protein AB7053_23155, partial [Escherichia coli]